LKCFRNSLELSEPVHHERTKTSSKGNIDFTFHSPLDLFNSTNGVRHLDGCRFHKGALGGEIGAAIRMPPPVAYAADQSLPRAVVTTMSLGAIVGTAIGGTFLLF
jgi:hypothetical protein